MTRTKSHRKVRPGSSQPGQPPAQSHSTKQKAKSKPKQKQKQPLQHTPNLPARPSTRPKVTKKEKLHRAAKQASQATAQPTVPARPPPISQSLLDHAGVVATSTRRSDTPAMYTFGGGGGRDSYRPSQGSNSLPDRPNGSKMKFTFNQVPSGPRFSRDSRDGRPSHRRPRGNHGGRRHFGKVAPHDRPIIRALNGRATTPDRLPGMTDGNITFKSLDELSESMSESDSEAEQNASSKRRRVEEPDASSRPAWSNPDPYTSLPPVFEPDRKKTDVVQFIRKAKVIQSQEGSATNAIVDNVDFVSLAFSDDEADEDSIATAPLDAKTSHGAKTLRTNALDESKLANPLPARPVLPDPPVPMSSSSHASRKRKLVRLGGVTSDWLAAGSVSTPWRPASYPHTTDMTWRLHEEILDFYSWVRPASCEDRVREHLVKRIEDVLCRSFRDCRVRAFGSFASGLYLPTGDMDLVLVSRDYERSGRPAMTISKSQMRRALNDLILADIARGPGSQIIATAKVPIVKFVDKSSDLKVDISFENLSGVVANGTYSSWKAQFPDLPLLVSVVKQFLLMRDLNEVFNGGLGGFSITCMVVSFLQVETGTQTDPAMPARNLGQLLIDFFDFYGKKFNMKTTQISFKPIGHFPKTVKFVGRKQRPEMAREKWCIIDPNNPDNDVSAGTTMAPLIASAFAEAADALRATMAIVRAIPAGHQEQQTILGAVIGGNYESFAAQRDRMDRLDRYYMSRR